jgi:hypothetical protein
MSVSKIRDKAEVKRAIQAKDPFQPVPTDAKIAFVAGAEMIDEMGENRA